LGPRYAAGRIFTPSLLGALFAQAYSTAGILELLEAMVMPSRRMQESFPFTLPIPPSFVNRTYESIVQFCLRDSMGIKTQSYCPVLPLGLYRSVSEAQQQSHQIVTEDSRGLFFVYTNPSKKSVLFPSDQIYVIASEEWGHCYHEHKRIEVSAALQGRGELTKLGTPTTDLGGFPAGLVPDDSMPGLVSSLYEQRSGAPAKHTTPMQSTCAGTGTYEKMDQTQRTEGAEISDIFSVLVGPTEAEVDSLVTAMFHRYDYDSSNTINNDNELRMLVTNLIYHLNAHLAQDCSKSTQYALDNIPPLGNGEAWDLEKFKKWFFATFEIPGVTNRAK